VPITARRQRLTAPGGDSGSDNPRARELSAGRVDVRPRGVGELLDLATEVLLARFVFLVGSSFVVWVVLGFLQRELGLLDPPDPESGLADVLALSLVNNMAVVAATVLISALATAATIRYLLGDHLRTVGLLRALPGLLLVTLTSAVILAVTLPLTLGVGTLLLWYKFIHAPAVAVVESPSPFRAFARSWQLTRGSFGRCLGVYFGATLLTMPLALAGAGLTTETVLEQLQVWAPTVPLWGVELLTLMLTALFNALPTAFGGVVLTVLYADALVRREGRDLDARLASRRVAFEQGAPPVTPSNVEGLA
jgi:hypothetical protein